MKRYWQDGRQATALWELLAVVISFGALLLLLWWRWPGARPHGSSVRVRCRNHLNHLAKGMATYLSEFGDNMYYPFPLGLRKRPNDFTGAEWLASLYWTGTVPDPYVFLCPASEDTNEDGIHIGSTRTTPSFGSQTVSYAGLHWRSATTTGSPIRAAEWSDNDVMASDDTQGTINHGAGRNAGMNVLFFDSHVEFKTADELDTERAVGQKGGLLEKLRN